ncbi:MAG: dihydrolipoamide acetyltransferase family protein [Spirochaetaceae bacterium]|nr:dihydrolipoamide acetyltransferase family protein [Spirochaetaceae bacterium]
MASRVIMPKQGLQMTEGTIISWLAKEGDAVEEGKPLFEMETDKLTIEISAPSTGTLLKIIRGEGDVVPITELIAVIGEAGEDISEILSEAGGTEEPESELSATESSKDKAVSQEAVKVERRPGERIFASPRARMRADEAGVDLANVSGSGPEGLIIERDVPSSAQAQPSATPLARQAADAAGVELSALSGSGPRGKVYRRDVDAASIPETYAAVQREDRLVKLTGMRRVISDRMRESLDTAAQAVHRIEVDMSEAVRLRTKLKPTEVSVSFNDIVMKSVARALLAHPRMNSRLTDEGILELGAVNVGMAVAVDDGLLVPVIRNTDLLTLNQIHGESRRLAEAARSGTLAPEDTQGGTFSVSNLGMFELDSFTAIINRPESGILAVGAIKERAVVVDGAVVPRPMCGLSLTYDHRVIDGAPAAGFLREVKDLLENPYLLL